MFERKYSYIIAAAIWGIPGINIAIKGVKTYMLMNPDDLWWLMLITLAVSIFFFITFRRVVRKYSERIASLPDSVIICQIFPPGCPWNMTCSCATEEKIFSSPPGFWPCGKKSTGGPCGKSRKANEKTPVFTGVSDCQEVSCLQCIRKECRGDH